MSAHVGPRRVNQGQECSEPRRRRLRAADDALFYGARGGGIRTYLEAKAAFAGRTLAFEHHLVFPGRPGSPDAPGDGFRHKQPSLRLAASNGYRIPLGGSGLQTTLLCALDPGATDESVYLERARETERALLARCHDPGTGLFFDLAGSAERPLQVSTWSSLAPLALTELPEDVRRRLVEEHLLDDRRYRAPFGIPSVSMEEASFRPGFQIWRCWRGPSWMNTSWLLVPAMRDLGYTADADRITDSMLLAVDRHGLREYYNPLTGVGLAARGFAFSALIVDLLPEGPFQNDGVAGCGRGHGAGSAAVPLSMPPASTTGTPAAQLGPRPPRPHPDSEMGPQSGNADGEAARPSAAARIMNT